MDWRMDLMQGDCLEMMAELDDASVDSIVTDPPYGLSFMGKRWDYDVPSVEIWAECLRVLKPGGHLLAFAGTRTQHRMAVRIEDAGFEIRDMIAWVYGSGFPKSHNVANSIDKMHGAGDRGHRIARASAFHPDGTKEPSGDNLPPYVARTEHGRGWEGWGTALKPALEPITVARKPLVGTVAQNVLTHGTGALNIDGCRVGDFVNTTPSGQDRYNARNHELGYRPNAYGRDGEASADRRYTEKGGTNSAATPGPRGGDPSGRWPANLMLSYPEDSYTLREDVSADGLRALAEWMDANPEL